LSHTGNSQIHSRYHLEVPISAAKRERFCLQYLVERGTLVMLGKFQPLFPIADEAEDVEVDCRACLHAWKPRQRCDWHSILFQKSEFPVSFLVLTYARIVTEDGALGIEHVDRHHTGQRDVLHVEA